uniref:Uncharacterized protein n=1 Tax=Picea glauca TaxID=3330 RepID=A0A101M2A4_PICGL|nr:hypothetical protein ABT39_MTgene2968 [Picea glauca]QHR89141.1 hypothetical protein Q903MT_gene3161 [Picea sitchensis]
MKIYVNDCTETFMNIHQVQNQKELLIALADKCNELFQAYSTFRFYFVRVIKMGLPSPCEAKEDYHRYKGDKQYASVLRVEQSYIGKFEDELNDL